MPGAAPASAIKPEIVEDVRFDPDITEIDQLIPPLEEACGFDVSFSTKGRFRGTVYFNADASFRRFVGHPSFRQTLSSEWGSITTDDRGVDKVTKNPVGHSWPVQVPAVVDDGAHDRVPADAELACDTATGWACLPTRRHACRRARSVIVTRGSSAGCCCVHEPAGHAGSGTASGACATAAGTVDRTG